MEKTPIYYIAKWEGRKNGNPILFFPEYPANAGRIGCYVHVGQRCAASMDYYHSLRNCRTPGQKTALADLLAEYGQFLEENEILVQVYRDQERFRRVRWVRS